MVAQSKFAQEGASAPAFSAHGRKPPSEKPKSALFRVISRDGFLRELTLRCGEEKEMFGRRVRLELVFSAEDTLSYSSPPAAMLSISHNDGSAKNNYFVEEGKKFHFGDYTFSLVEVR